MYEIKTKENDNDVMHFIEGIENIRKREDALKLLKIFTETTVLEAKMWGASMIGFGTYHYKYASGHEGDAMITGFSPRKAKISLYLSASEAIRYNVNDNIRDNLLNRLGKHTAGKGCIYINSLSDINESVLREFIVEYINFICSTYPRNSLANKNLDEA